MASPNSQLSTRGFSRRFRAGLAATAVAATAALVAGCAPPSPLGQGDNPSGAVDSVYLTDGGVVVSGWASDRNSPAPVEVVFTVAGRLRPERIAASGNRPDLGALIGRSDRGYSIYLPIPGATAATAVCVSAINVGPGASSLLGCRRAVDSAPVTPPTTTLPPPVPEWLDVGGTARVSVASDGTQSNNASDYLSISADGRYVAFQSPATNLVPGDTNGAYDVFVRDSVAGTTTRVSVASDGAEGDRGSYNPSISADGRYVAFESDATNLVPGDMNVFTDIFVRDTVAGTTMRVSVASDGAEGDDSPGSPSISADGRYVAFESRATNLVPGDINGAYDVFVRDSVAGTTTRVSVASGGAEGNDWSTEPAISADGRYVAFRSDATNLVAGDTNGFSDVFVRDTVSGTTARVSVASGGVEGDDDSTTPAISADGRYVAFRSYALNLAPGDSNGVADAFVRDTVAGTTARVSVASDGTQSDARSIRPAISADGRYVAFESDATNLVPGDNNFRRDVFVRDTVSGATARVSVASGGVEANDDGTTAAISADGRYVAFRSFATNLVAGDTNVAWDVFAHRMR